MLSLTVHTIRIVMEGFVIVNEFYAHVLEIDIFVVPITFAIDILDCLTYLVDISSGYIIGNDDAGFDATLAQFFTNQTCIDAASASIDVRIPTIDAITERVQDLD